MVRQENFNKIFIFSSSLPFTVCYAPALSRPHSQITFPLNLIKGYNFLGDNLPSSSWKGP